MRVIVKHPRMRPEVRDIDPGFESVRAIIGDWFERAITGPGVDVYCDEAGLHKNLTLNVVRPSDGSRIVGTIVAVANGDDRDLDDREIALWMATLSLIGDDPTGQWRSAALAELEPQIHVGDVALFQRLRNIVGG